MDVVTAPSAFATVAAVSVAVRTTILSVATAFVAMQLLSGL